MTKVKGKDFEPLGGRAPKKLADSLKQHANQLGMTYTDVYVMALERYLASPESRVAVLEAQVRGLAGDVRLLKSHLAARSDWTKSMEGRIAELAALVPQK